MENSGNDILRFNMKEHNKIYTRMSNMSAEKENIKNRIEKSDRTSGEDMKKDIHRSYHQVTKKWRKRFDISNTRSILENDSSESSQRMTKGRISVTRLVENWQKFTWNSRRNPNGQRNNIHFRRMEKEMQSRRNGIYEDDSISSTD